MAVNANEKSIHIENVLIQDKIDVLCDNRSNLDENLFKND